MPATLRYGTVMALVWLALPVSAPAEGPRGQSASFQWVRSAAARDCADGAEIRSALREGSPDLQLVAPEHSELLVEGYLQRRDDLLEASLTLLDRTGRMLGERKLTGRDCDQLLQTLVVVMATMLDPSAAALTGAATNESEGTATVPPPEPVPPPEQCPCLPEEPTAPPAPPTETTPARVPASLLRNMALGGRMSLGLMPGAAIAATVHTHLQLSVGGSLHLGGAAYIENTQQIDPAPKRDARFRVLHASLGYCPAFFIDENGSVAFCAGLHGGVIQSRAEGFEPLETRTNPLLLGSVGSRVTMLTLNPLTLGVSAALFSPLVRTRFEYERTDGSPEEIFDQPALGGMFDLSLGLRFD